MKPCHLGKISPPKTPSKKLTLAISAALASAALMSFTAQAATVNSQWNTGTIGNWNTPANWTPIVSPDNNDGSGDDYNVSISGATSNATLTASTLINLINITSDATLNIANNAQLRLATNNFLQNSGTVNFNSLGNISGILFEGLGNTDIIGTGEFNLGNSLANRLVTNADGNTIINSALHTIQGGGTLLNNLGGFINQGNLFATNPVGFVINPGANGFVNTGNMVAQSSSTNGFQLNTGSYDFNAAPIIENGSRIRSNTSAGSSTFTGSVTINAGGDFITQGSAANSLNNFTFDGNGEVLQQNNTNFEILGGVTNNSNWKMRSLGNATTVNFIGGGTLTGDGILTGENNSSQNRIITGAGNTIINDVNHAIQGTYTLLNNNGFFTNNGSLQSNGTASVVIDPGTGGTGFTNNGSMLAVGSGGFALQGGTYNFNNNPVVLAGSKINLNTGSGEIILNGSAQVGGGANINALGSNNNVVLNSFFLFGAGNFNQNNNQSVEINGNILTTSGATWNMNSLGNFTDIIFNDGGVLSGTGSIVASNNTSNRIRTTTDTSSITNNAGKTLSGTFSILDNTGGFINNGTLLATGSAATQINPGSEDFVNNGDMRAQGSGGFTLQGGNYVFNSAPVVESGSRITLQTNSAAPNDVRLNGSVQIDAGAQVRTNGSTPLVLNNFAFDGAGEFNQLNNSKVTVNGGAVSNATWNLLSLGNPTDILFTNGGSLNGNGDIVASNNNQNRILTTANGTSVTLSAGKTMQGAFTLLNDVGGFVNEGSIIAENTAITEINPGTDSFINNGSLIARGTGGIRLHNGDYQFNNAPVVESGSRLILNTNTASTVELNGSLQIDAGGFATTNGASSALQLNNFSLFGSGDFVHRNNEDVQINGGLVHSDVTWNMNSVGNQTDIILNGGGTLGGTGDIVTTNNNQNRILTTANGTNVVLAAGKNITGGFSLLNNVGGFINNGTITSTGSAISVLDPGTDDFVNNGSLIAAGTGGIQLSAGNYQFNNALEVLSGSRLLFSTNTPNLVEINGSINLNAGATARTNGASSDLQLNNINLNGDGTFNIRNNEGVDINDGGITNNANITMSSLGNQTDIVFNGNSTIDGTGQIVASNNINNRILVASNSDTLTNSANHQLEGGLSLLANSGSLTNNGIILANTSVGINIDPGAGGSVVNNGQIIANSTVRFIDGQFENANGGVLSGSGTFDISDAGTTFINNGTISPGNSPGILSFEGSLDLSSASSELLIELAGTTVGTEYDQLQVSDDINLGGALTVDLLSGFTPTAFDVFRIITASAVSGAFLNTPGDIYSFAAGQFTVFYGADFVELRNFTAAADVPAPAGIMLMMLLIAGLSLRQARMARASVLGS